MDATVDDFFNEINEIAPPKPTKERECDWQECYDKLTGYSYYWNVKTDKVTWNTPAEFKAAKDPKKEKVLSKKKNLYVPPRVAPLFPVTSAKVSEDTVKIYSIGENSKEHVPEKPLLGSQKPRKRPYKSDSDSEEEKIELISSYGEESESEDEEPDKKISKKVNARKFSGSNVSDEDDNLDILTKIQKRAKELKDLGGDLPPEITNIVSQPKIDIVNSVVPVKEKKKTVGGVSLVAGYSDSEEEQETEKVKSVFPVAPELPKISHSTLFPITKPIDVTDFMQPTIVENKPTSPSSDFDSKAFQRKRRIGVALVNTAKKKDDIPDNLETERKGFGFNSDDTRTNVEGNLYLGSKKGGVMFVKSDVLNPTPSKAEETSLADEGKKTEETSGIRKEEVEAMYTSLQEKLGFLGEGRPPVLPVQAMVIQAEMLFMAMKDGGLKLSYLQKWLNDTCSELIKLEKEAAPEGWLLQWDRSVKRYYYQNQTTGEGQWEYPQPDVDRCDEAMDISTTPPPADPMIHMSPPLPPIIRSPTPPPPPIISINTDVSPVTELPDVPLPPEPAPLPKFTDDEEPLPPGVDLPEIMSYHSKEKDPKPADPLYSALDSFYSDIAAIETTNSHSPPPPPPPPSIDCMKMIAEAPTESVKKKKKTKVKLAPGLSMKKKGVSQLVEKWRSVQQHYND